MKIKKQESIEQRKIGSIILTTVVGSGNLDPNANTDPTPDPNPNKLDPAIGDALNNPEDPSLMDEPILTKSPTDPVDLTPSTDPVKPIDPVDPAKPTDPVKPVEYQVNTYWDQLKGQLHTDAEPWEVPEIIKTGKNTDGTPITPQQSFDLLVNTIHANTQDDYSKLSPLAKDFMTRVTSDENFDEAKWLTDVTRNHNMMAQSSEDFMFNHLKNTLGKTDEKPDGQTDEQIRETVDKQKESGTLDVMTQQLKTQYQTNIDRVAQEDHAKQVTGQTIQWETFEKNQTATVNALITKNKDITDIYGIVLSEADKIQYDKEFPAMLKVNRETGKHQIQKFLQSDDNLYKIGAIIWKGDSGMKQHLSSLKESVKDDTLNKLDISPQIKEGQIAQPGDIDANLLATPEDAEIINQ